MRRTLGINVLQCTVCQATMLLLAVITKREVIDRIVTHVKVPREPVLSDEPSALYFDVTGEPVPSWVLGVDPDPDERGPPTDWNLVGCLRLRSMEERPYSSPSIRTVPSASKWMRLRSTGRRMAMERS